MRLIQRFHHVFSIPGCEVCFVSTHRNYFPNQLMRKVISILSILACHTFSEAQTINFFPAANTGVPALPYGIVSSDFNNDGHADLAVPSQGSNSVSILLGNGSGGFGAPTSFNAGTLPLNLAVGDFNGDTHRDIVVSNMGASNITLLPGNGSGGFGLPVDYASGFNTWGIAVGDFNEDGNQDVVTSSTTSGVAILLGNGLGSFGLPSGYTTPGGPSFIAVDDVNGDNHQDFAVTNQAGNNVSVFIGSGTGTFTTATNYPVQTNPIGIVIADFNGDTNKDIAVANMLSKSISILPGDGLGNFGSASNFSAGGEAVGVLATDFNLDGLPDLAVTNRDVSSVTVLTGAGSGSFNAPKSFTVATGPRGITASDFNGDGNPDLASAGYTSGNISVLLFNPASPAPTISSFTPSSGNFGTTVTIFGTNFDPTAANNTVTFNGVVAAAPPAATATSLTVTVPPGTTTGPISVTTANGTGTSTSNFTVTSCVPAIERAALLALYNSTDGPNWGTANQNWLSPDESTWYGIKVTNCHIEEIDLAYVNLQGSIPAELKDLVELDSLVLLSDGLTGIIPAELGQLSKLKHLLIGSSGTGNNITGTLPKEIGNLTNLIRLALVGGHTLTGPIPTEYGNLINLEDMTLQGGDYVSDATSGQTGLTGNIPASVANLPKLKYLYLQENQLSGPIPSSFSPTLEWLEIGGNQFSGNIPSSLANTNLRGLYLYRNQLTGSIPESLGNLNNLQWINLRSNNLTGSLPTTFQNLNVRLFTVYNNHLEGEIPDSWGASMDWEFRIENNDFTKIPKFTKAFNFFAGGLKVDNNFLDFGSLELNVGKTPSYTYTPQKNLTGGAVSATTGSTLVIPFFTGGTQNGYQWYKDGSPIVGATSQEYAKANAQLTDAGSYTVHVTNSLVTGLTLISDPFIVTVTACPSPPLTTSNSGCSGSAINLSASGGTPGQYRWYTAASGGTPDTQQNATFNTPALTNTTSFWVAINDGTCESPRAEVIATVLPLPTAPVVQPVSPVCPGSGITFIASGGANGEYRWYDGTTLLVGEVNNMLAIANVTSTKSFSASINDGTCESNKTSVTATVKSCTAPSVESTVATAFMDGVVAINLETLISDPEDDLDPASLEIIEQPQSGASATLEGFNLNIDYSGIAFSGTDRVTVGICDLTNLCTEQAVTIELGGQIKIYNAVSPNGDGKNEIFFIQYIELLPETQRNTVSIYNRWGDEVFHTKNYNNTSNVFKGESNTGDKLPTGTYFYKIVFSSGKTRTGFLELKH